MQTGAWENLIRLIQIATELLQILYSDARDSTAWVYMLFFANFDTVNILYFVKCNSVRVGGDGLYSYLVSR